MVKNLPFYNIEMKLYKQKRSWGLLWRSTPIYMTPKKKENNNDLRNLVLQHYQNGDSQREIAAKTLLPRSTVQYMIEK